MGRVTRAAYADAFRKVTGRPLVRLPQMAGRTESEIFFEALALNQAESLACAPGALLLNARTRAAEKYGVEFTEDATVYIADSGRDVAAARMGGVRSVGVASGRSSAGELRDAGADVVLADLSDTANVVRAVDWLTTSVPAG